MLLEITCFCVGCTSDFGLYPATDGNGKVSSPAREKSPENRFDLASRSRLREWHSIDGDVLGGSTYHPLFIPLGFPGLQPTV